VTLPPTADDDAMQVDLFDFDLPEDRIALRPVRPRDAARLMVVAPGEANRHLHVHDLPDLLAPGDMLVVNDTKVIPAELRGERIRGDAMTRISVTLYRRADASNWWAFARPARRLAPGDRLRFGALSDNACLIAGLDATVAEAAGEGRVKLSFDLAGPALDEAIAAHGHMPLPSYIASRRPEDAADRTDYQTVYARQEGAIASPTAGLHFTPELLQRLREKGVGEEAVTLHVGPGTFLPVKTETVAEHAMHSEWGTIAPETANAINEAKRNGGRIVAVGTTSLRLLESAADEDGIVHPFSGETDIFITPGYHFRVVDVLLTNFHLPRSTLFMLVSAFAGRERMLAAYREAIAAGYRFYSYGDASLLFRAAA
jgi:S-adenosylmethionine:tRNA ribosyltransferase-isomerase